MKIVLILVLAGLLWFEWVLDPVQPPPVRIHPAPLPEMGDRIPADAWRLGAMADYEVIGRRTLFRPERKAPKEGGGTSMEVPGPQQVEDLDLVAVLITPKGRLAWVRDGEAEDLTRLKVGDSIRGWKVKAVEPGQIVLKRGPKEARIPLLQYPERVEPAVPKARPGKRPFPRLRPRGLPRPPRK